MVLTEDQKKMIDALFSENKIFGARFLQTRFILLLADDLESRSAGALSFVNDYIDLSRHVIVCIEKLFKLYLKQEISLKGKDKVNNVVGKKIVFNALIENLSSFDEKYLESDILLRKDAILNTLEENGNPVVNANSLLLPDEIPKDILLLEPHIKALLTITGLLVTSIPKNLSSIVKDDQFWIYARNSYYSSLLLNYDAPTILDTCAIHEKTKIICRLEKPSVDNGEYLAKIAHRFFSAIDPHGFVNYETICRKVEKHDKELEEFRLSLLKMEPKLPVKASFWRLDNLIMYLMLLISIVILLATGPGIFPVTALFFANLSAFFFAELHNTSDSLPENRYQDEYYNYSKMLVDTHKSLQLEYTARLKMHRLQVHMPKEVLESVNEQSVQQPIISSKMGDQKEENPTISFFVSENECIPAPGAVDDENISTDDQPSKEEDQAAVDDPMPPENELNKKPKQKTRPAPAAHASSENKNTDKNKAPSRLPDKVVFTDSYKVINRKSGKYETVTKEYVFIRGQETKPAVRHLIDHSGRLFGCIKENLRIPPEEAKAFDTALKDDNRVKKAGAKGSGVRLHAQKEVFYDPELKCCVQSTTKLKQTEGITRLYGRTVGATMAIVNGNLIAPEKFNLQLYCHPLRKRAQH